MSADASEMVTEKLSNKIVKNWDDAYKVFLETWSLEEGPAANLLFYILAEYVVKEDTPIPLRGVQLKVIDHFHQKTGSDLEDMVGSIKAIFLNAAEDESLVKNHCCDDGELCVDCFDPLA